MKRVLLLAYFFPPLGGAGVQRAVKLVRYLPEHGWEPVVVTTRSRAYPAADESLLCEVPEGVTVRRAAEPPLWRMAGYAVDWLNRHGLRGAFLWPDDALGWAPAALWHGLREIRRRRPDVILSSSAPYTGHLVARALHRLTGIPWVADFRDEWAGNPHAAGQPRAAVALSRRAEARIARDAAARTIAAAHYRLAGGGPEPVHIPNGVDEADFERLPAPQPAVTDRLRLSHVGTLYAAQDCAEVLAALRRLVADGRLDPAKLELRVVGNLWLEDFDAPVPVTRTGYVDHRTALAEMRTATALLYYVDGASRNVAGKLYEYLVSERPILCVTRRDTLAFELVERWGAGLCAPPDDPDAIEAALLELVRRWEAGELHGSAAARAGALERFSRRALAGRMAEVLNRACA